jgi:hypothetical protein
VTKNGKVVTFASTNGTAFNTAAVQIGDSVRISSAFNAANLGVFTIISKTSTSFSFENELGMPEVVVLGANFAQILSIYSSAGVQVGDKVDVVAGFSPASQNTYEILNVSHDYIEFFSSSVLPVETGIANTVSALLIYNNSKQFFYLETNGKVGIKYNGSTDEQIVDSFVLGGHRKPGIVLIKADLKSVVITNKTSAQVELYCITAE